MQTATAELIETFTREANEPKDRLIALHRRICNSIGSDSRIARQLSAIITDLELWQNR